MNEAGLPAKEPPLARLFAMAYRSLIESLHERLVARGWTDVRPAFGFVLLATTDRPTTSTEVATLMGTTKQAASKLLAAMLAAGYVEHSTGTADGRVRPVRLTDRGRQLLATVEEIYQEREAEWAAVVGARSVENVRRDIARVLRSENGGELPPVRPTW